MKKRTDTIFWVILFLFAAAQSPVSNYAMEPICPGGANPGKNIIYCLDFDSNSNCSNGREVQCWNDNGLSEGDLSSAYGFRIKSQPGAVGPGFLSGKGEYGSTGPGYTTMVLPGGGADAVNMRFYIRYADGYMSYIAGHGPGIMGKAKDCSRSVTFEHSQFYYHLYCTGTAGCGGGSFDLMPNKDEAFALKNNRWYLVEIQVVIDTNCEKPNDPFGCNGEARIWIDETLVLEYTNINWGGVAAGMKWPSIWGPRNYFHVRAPKWEPELHYDNFVVSTDGDYIGPAVDENDRGIEDPKSPYLVEQGIEPFLGGHPNTDCSTPSGYLKTTYGNQWRNGATLESEIIHAGYIDQCNDPPRADNSMKVELKNSGEGGGISYDRRKGMTQFSQQVLKGFVYLPSTNDYSKTPALSGFRGYSCGTTCDDAKFGRLVAMTADRGGWAIVQRSRPVAEDTEVVLNSSAPVQFDKWLEFEIIVWQDQKVSLMIDRKRIFNKADLPYPVNWLFDENQPNNGSVLGVIDFKGAPPFVAYYDDISVGSASFWSCDGWDNSSCPVMENNGELFPPAILEIKVN